VNKTLRHVQIAVVLSIDMWHPPPVSQHIHGRRQARQCKPARHLWQAPAINPSDSPSYHATGERIQHAKALLVDNRSCRF